MHAGCLPGADVTVRVNGEPLTEYATENGDLSATTFVEAIAGAEFNVTLKWSEYSADQTPADRIAFSVFVDGEWIRTPVVSTHGWRDECTVNGPQEIRNGLTTTKCLTFAQHDSSRQ